MGVITLSNVEVPPELRKVAHVASRRRRATEELHQAIFEASRAGFSARRIATHAGLSNQRVSQILRRSKED